MTDTERPSAAVLPCTPDCTSLIRHLAIAQVASCRCRTKTPDPEIHADRCPYKVLCDAISLLNELAPNDVPLPPESLRHLTVGPGWHGILRPLLAAFLKLGVKVTDVKEKYGTMRLHLDNYSPIADVLVDVGEVSSAEICEMCGAPGRLRDGAWIKTLCDSHVAALIVQTQPKDLHE